MPGAFIDQDLAGMFVTAEFASTATWRPATGAAVPGRVIVDHQSSEVLDQVTARDLSVIYETAVWPAVTERDQVEILVGAMTMQFLVQRIEQLADGKVCRAHLRAA